MRIAAGVVFLLAYGFYVRRTLASGGEVQGEETLNPLIFDRRAGERSDPPTWLIVVQLLVGLGAMVFGAHLFVEHLLGIADALGADPLVLALILAPLATELPEKVNSFFWVREGKDALALGNLADPAALPALERATHDPEPLIAEHAHWAIAQIESRKV